MSKEKVKLTTLKAGEATQLYNCVSVYPPQNVVHMRDASEVLKALEPFITKEPMADDSDRLIIECKRKEISIEFSKDEKKICKTIIEWALQKQLIAMSSSEHILPLLEKLEV